MVYTGSDANGRKYLTVEEAKVGMTIELDSGFTCSPGCKKEIKKDSRGELYFDCGEGTHMLDGQVEKSKDGTEFYMGVYPAE